MKTYITTAIPYVNGAPHIGHALDYLQADVCARYHRQCGDEVRFQAGTDEHGSKIFEKAKANNIPVERYVDDNSHKFQDFISKLGVEYTDFIRTTDDDHMRRCQSIWTKLKPHIYKATYEGWYCDGCESFVSQKEYDANGGICPDHQKPYTKLSEENYYLRIADFKEQIAAALTDGTCQVLPDFRKQEILNLLADSPDVSISRPRKNLTWGIPVPDDDSQVMYVWMDALTNYITILGYPEQDISDWWPATTQFVGKDVLRFHAIIWPSILLGLGLPLPKTILAHGHVLSNNQKMSKSLGNVVDPIEAIDKHGLPAFRYFFLRHIDTFADSDFTWDKFESAYNNELANDLGNLVQRLAAMSSKNQIQTPDFKPTADTTYDKLMQDLQFSKALDYIWEQIQNINKQIDESKPWELAKQGSVEQLTAVLQDLIQQLLQATYLLTPFLPTTAKQINDIFTSNPITPSSAPLFPKERN